MVAPVEPPAAPKPAVPRSARILGSFGRSLITTGVVVLLFVIFQLWGTNILESRAQEDLRDQFDSTLLAAQTQLAAFDAGVLTPISQGESTPVSAGEIPEEPEVLPTETKPEVVPADTTTSTLPGGFDPEVLAFFFPEDGDAVARIEIPAIGLDKIVVNGVQVVDLRKGPGRYPGTAPVGTEGNVGIAGHRTTYGAPFNRIDELQPGDEIRMTGLLGSFTYRVMTPEAAYPDQLPDVLAQGNGHIIVPPGATWVLGDFGDNRITLTACNPKYSARERIIVAAELIEAPAATPVFDPEVVAAYTGYGSRETQIPGEIQLPGETQIPAETPVPAEALTPSEESASLEAQLSGEARPGDDATAIGRSPTDAATANLDEGLNGERDAIPGAIMWMLLAIALWSIGRIVARRLFEERSPRIAVRLVALIPTATALWFSFEMIDRALPAG